jgi:hypothetical protein
MAKFTYAESITGRVTNTSSTPLSGVTVGVYDSAGTYQGKSSITDASGNYTIASLTAGDYKLLFNANSTGYFTQWYNNKTTLALADAITVTSGTTTNGINASLVLGGSIIGKITNSAGTGIAGVSVYAYDAVSGNGTNSGYTQSDGSYSIVGLTTGSYKLKFAGNTTGYITQWYNNKTSLVLADAISVATGVTTSGINATMILGGKIYGNVTNTSSVPLSGVTIGIYDPTGTYRGLSSTTDASGNYSVTDIPIVTDASGNYIPVKVQFSKNGYASQWFNNSPTAASATKVALNSGSINAKLLIDTYLLTVNFAGIGNGSVHSSPMSDISCMKGISSGCSAQFAPGSFVTLDATPDSSSSIFNGWSSDCLNTPCTVTMNSNKNVIANFSLAPRSKLTLEATTGYDTLQSAYNNAYSTIFSVDGLFSGDWLLGLGKDIILKGGYLADYAPTRSGFTTLNGKLTISSGSLRVDLIKVNSSYSIDGGMIYQTSCAGCHGALANSTKTGVTLTRLQSAIAANTGGMGVFSTLSSTQLQAIVNALAPAYPLNTCGSCHAMPPATGKHSIHNSQNIDCATCHGSGYSTTTVNATTHNNGTKNVASAIGWNATNRTCANSCHENRSW